MCKSNLDFAVYDLTQIVEVIVLADVLADFCMLHPFICFVEV